MKWVGTISPFASLRCPVSIGWRMSMRTSATSPTSVALILIGSAMFDSVQTSAAAADGDFDFLHARIELSVGLHDCAQVRGLAHFDAHGGVRLCAVGDVERGRERERILLGDDRDALG